ncbi:hypothetical protein Pelo_4864 [Pelomyxa schiedti]|nr:hypothetical protein Pelo_4864 [Pelomyxa schiedti]
MDGDHVAIVHLLLSLKDMNLNIKVPVSNATTNAATTISNATANATANATKNATANATTTSNATTISNATANATANATTISNATASATTTKFQLHPSAFTAQGRDEDKEIETVVKAVKAHFQKLLDENNFLQGRLAEIENVNQKLRTAQKNWEEESEQFKQTISTMTSLIPAGISQFAAKELLGTGSYGAAFKVQFRGSKASPDPQMMVMKLQFNMENISTQTQLRNKYMTECETLSLIPHHRNIIHPLGAFVIPSLPQEFLDLIHDQPAYEEWAKNHKSFVFFMPCGGVCLSAGSAGPTTFSTVVVAVAVVVCDVNGVQDGQGRALVVKAQARRKEGLTPARPHAGTLAQARHYINFEKTLKVASSLNPGINCQALQAFPQWLFLRFPHLSHCCVIQTTVHIRQLPFLVESVICAAAEATKHYMWIDQRIIQPELQSCLITAQQTVPMMPAWDRNTAIIIPQQLQHPRQAFRAKFTGIMTIHETRGPQRTTQQQLLPSKAL